jgi:hypothetical protein
LSFAPPLKNIALSLEKVKDTGVIAAGQLHGFNEYFGFMQQEHKIKQTIIARDIFCLSIFRNRFIFQFWIK